MSPREPSSLCQLSIGAARSPEDLQGLWRHGLEIVELSLRRPGTWERPCRALGSDPTVDWLRSPARETLLAEGLRQTLGRSYGFLQALASSGLEPEPWLALLLRDFLERCRRCHDPLGHVVSLSLRLAVAEKGLGRDPPHSPDAMPSEPGDAFSGDSQAVDRFEAWWTRRGSALAASLTQSRSLEKLESLLRQHLPELDLQQASPAARLDLEEQLTAALYDSLIDTQTADGTPGPMKDLLRRLGRLPEAREWARNHRLLACVQEAVDHLGVDERATDRLRTLWLLLLVARSGELSSWPAYRDAAPDGSATGRAFEAMESTDTLDLTDLTKLTEAIDFRDFRDFSEPSEPTDAIETHQTLSALAGILRRLLRACGTSEDPSESFDGSVREACLLHLLEIARPLPAPARHRIREGDFVTWADREDDLPILWLCVQVHTSRGEGELMPTGPLGLGGLPQLVVSTPLGPLTVHCSFPHRRPLSELRGVPGNPSLPREEIRRALAARQAPAAAPPREVAAAWTEDQLEHWHRLRRAMGPGREKEPSSPPRTRPEHRRKGCFQRLVSFFALDG